MEDAAEDREGHLLDATWRWGLSSPSREVCELFRRPKQGARFRQVRIGGGLGGGVRRGGF